MVNEYRWYKVKSDSLFNECSVQLDDSLEQVCFNREDNKPVHRSRRRPSVDVGKKQVCEASFYKLNKILRATSGCTEAHSPG